MIALTRAVSPSLDRCRLTHLPREPIDVERAERQHAAYEAALEDAGCTIERVSPAPDLPDAVFVEDTAVVLDEVAVLARPGAPERRAEVEAVAAVLATHRPVHAIEAPATLDGGDVLRVGRDVFIGRSGRTDAAGAEALAAILEPLGYRVRPVAVEGCLHLKSAVTAVTDDTLLVHPGWVDTEPFGRYHLVKVDSAEPHAANVLRVGGVVVSPAAHPATNARLARRGIRVVEVDVSELARAEGGVTCCSILLRKEGR